MEEVPILLKQEKINLIYCEIAPSPDIAGTAKCPLDS